MDGFPEFSPPLLLGSPLVQSFLASAKFRARGKNSMRRAAREVIITTSAGPGLQGFYSPQPNGGSKGLVVLLHGWEGNADSTYVLCTGRSLYEHGYSVFRLNLRDHGDSHHLNEGLFFGTLFDEVFSAVVHATSFEPDRKSFIIGFSLGGNYALRIARHCHDHPVPSIRHIVAVSPVIDPAKATREIDRHTLFRYYFMKKWRQSLLKKQHVFPNLFDFSDVIDEKSIWDLTEKLLVRHTHYESPEQYFATYTLSGTALANIPVPTSIITAEDDPIIPVSDFRNLRLSRSARLIVQRRGGHNGFICGYDFSTWYSAYVIHTFAAA